MIRAAARTKRKKGEKLLDGGPEYAWTDITYLLHATASSWNYYVAAGGEPDCEDGEMKCTPAPRATTSPGSGTSCPGSTT